MPIFSRPHHQPLKPLGLSTDRRFAFLREPFGGFTSPPVPLTPPPTPTPTLNSARLLHTPSLTTLAYADDMTGSATITFSQAGVRPPVYVVTSLSNPPWATLELTPTEDSPGQFVFKRRFENTVEGSFQYKIRIGEGHWVVDESKESATDEHGNRNNVVHVGHTSDDDTTTSYLVAEKQKDAAPNTRNDSTLDFRLPVAPVPFVVVDKVADMEQPEYGDVEPNHLPKDTAKRAADAEANLEYIRPDTRSLEISTPPLDADDDAAPLFRHESFQAIDSSQSLTESAEAASLQSSTEVSSGDAMDTPSEEGEVHDDELSFAPLLSHETGFSGKTSEVDEPLLPHEMGGADEHDELSLAPLLSHETGFSGNHGEEDSDYEDELDLAPLLSHETGFSHHKRSEKNDDEEDWGPQHYQHSQRSKSFEGQHAPKLPHESLLDEDYGVPLLPHERTSAGSFSSSERSFSHSSIPDTNHPTQGYEAEYAREIFGAGRPTFFRTNSSTLPHRLPKSDEEDHDLRDAALEPFPVGRDQILARVATIGHKLPEDETLASPSSPHASVFSQSCSSVELAPVKSYLSLASVREDEEEEDDYGDYDSVSSPIFMSSRPPAFARDPLATPHANESKQLGCIPEDKPDKSSMRTAESSETGSVSKTDGTTDISKGTSKTSDPDAATATLSSTLTSPHTPPVESEIRQRREPAMDLAADADEPYTHTSKSSAISQQPEKPSNAFLDLVMRNRKPASVAALVIGAAYYWVALR